MKDTPQEPLSRPLASASIVQETNGGKAEARGAPASPTEDVFEPTDSFSQVMDLSWRQTRSNKRSPLVSPKHIPSCIKGLGLKHLIFHLKLHATTIPYNTLARNAKGDIFSSLRF